MSVRGEPLDPLTLVAVAATAFSVSVAAHEVGQTLAGTLAGGRPTLLTATGVRGDWADLSVAGRWATGLGGTLASFAVGGSALVTAGAGRTRGAGAVFAWLLGAVSLLGASVHMVLSPLFSFGDWDMAFGVGAVRGRTPVAAAGVVAVVLAYRAVSAALGRVLGPGPRVDRLSRADALTRPAWLGGSLVLLVAAALGPQDLEPSLLTSLGWIGPAVLIFPAGRRVGARPATGAAPLTVARSWGWIGVGTVVSFCFVLVLGRGVRL